MASRRGGRGRLRRALQGPILAGDGRRCAVACLSSRCPMRGHFPCLIPSPFPLSGLDLDEPVLGEQLLDGVPPGLPFVLSRRGILRESHCQLLDLFVEALSVGQFPAVLLEDPPLRPCPCVQKSIIFNKLSALVSSK